MEEVNALKIRNHLGEVLDQLTKTGEPILVSKGREIRAVLVTPEQFQRRFLDWQAEHERKVFLDRLKTLRASKKGTVGSLSTLRQLRGYGS